MLPKIKSLVNKLIVLLVVKEALEQYFEFDTNVPDLKSLFIALNQILMSIIIFYLMKPVLHIWG